MMQPSGMVYWRFKNTTSPWKFGYVSSCNSPNLIRMGSYNGDTMGGHVVSVSEIEWKDYRT